MTPVSIIRSSNRVTSAPKAKHLLHLRALASLSWLTARRAAKIEPTIQEPISKIRALKKRPTQQLNNTFQHSYVPPSRVACLPEARVFKQ